MNVDIFIKRLRLYGRHGVLPQEREVGANFYVTLTAVADVSDEALLHDRLEGTVDYSKLVEVLEREMAKPSALLEHAAMRMASSVLRDFPIISRVELELEKQNCAKRIKLRNFAMNLYLVSQKMGNLSIGLELMIVGMLTVFVILLIVIWGGKLLIAVVNKVAPEEVVPAKKSAKPASTIDGGTMAILQEVVSQITGGKGKVASAKKI